MDETHIQIKMHGLFYLKVKLGFKRVLLIIVESNNILNADLAAHFQDLFMAKLCVLIITCCVILSVNAHFSF